MSVRIAIVAESFPPDVNGVAHCTLRIAEHLVARGHQPLVIAPAPAPGAPGAAGPFPCPVVRLRSVPVPRYRNFRIALPGPGLRAAVAGHRADLVHLASPFVLGSGRSAAAHDRGLPDRHARVRPGVPDGPAGRGRGLALGAPDPQRRRPDPRPVHGQCRQPARARVERVWVWGRGVDTRLFDPAKRSERLRRELAPGGEVLAGYVGRLAPEKRVDLLAQVAERCPGPGW